MNATQQTVSALPFRTPSRILIPKLVRSRDSWKTKATQRKAQCKALQIRVRDLEASRERYRQRAEQLQQRVTQLETQLATAQRPAPAPVPAPTHSPKNSTDPAAGTTTSPPSTSR